MTSLHESMIEYKKQMQAGTIPTAYKGLMEYMLDLRTHFQNNHPDYFFSIHTIWPSPNRYWTSYRHYKALPPQVSAV